MGGTLSGEIVFIASLFEVFVITKKIRQKTTAYSNHISCIAKKKT